MWILFAFLSALFAGATSILAKCGIRKTDSTVATAIRTGVVLLMSILMVIIVGTFRTITEIKAKTWILLVLSGLATGGSWLCWFKALSMGDVNQIVPVDKSSVVLSMLFAWWILGEPMTVLKGGCIVLIAVGTFLMIEKKENASGGERKGRGWLFFAILSAVLAALTSILGKIGIEGVESNLGTAIRTAVVFVMAWIVVLATGRGSRVKATPRGELLFICLSGIATGGSWLCYYKALRDGLAGVVIPIDKLSILVTVVFSYFVFGEKLTKKAIFGLVLMVLGTLGLLI